MEQKVNNRMMRNAMNKLNTQESVKILRELLKAVNDVRENQEQMGPALVSIYQYMEFVDEKLTYTMGLAQRNLREKKIPYDDFVKMQPKPLVKMEME